MRVPQDIANPLAVAIRDVLWYRPNVLSFLKDCNLPKPILAEVKKQQQSGIPTIKTVHYILDELDGFGDEGWVVAKCILTKMNYWKDMTSIAPERREQAAASLAAFRAVMKEFEAEQEYRERKEREKRERAMQEEREARGRISKLDHAKLQAFRDEFDAVYILEDKKERGDRFEALMNRIFSYYSERSEGPFERTGEQVATLPMFRYFVIERPVVLAGIQRHCSFRSMGFHKIVLIAWLEETTSELFCLTVPIFGAFWTAKLHSTFCWQRSKLSWSRISARGLALSRSSNGEAGAKDISDLLNS